ncbi:extracellular solute-binding protein family 5 [Methylotenera mobilis JLW8]|uniref:Extracellular solute-binding protein family 5 n=2 Tax=Methylotenera mobilis TaxID=359408 RepID=C6WUN4_METML|nr:extracellular solute-binding protein family 5 [Methylotenera mobilis JLW8]
MRMRFLNVLLLICFLQLSACGVESKHENAQQPIRFALSQAPLSLDPRVATDAASERVLRLIYQPLVDFDQHYKPNPKLATWQMLSATEYLITLKSPRAPFHNQLPLNAADVKATYDAITQLANSPLSAEYANIQNIVVHDEDHLTFYLKQPDPYFAAKLIIGIMPKPLLEQQHDFARFPVGNGPLAFVEKSNKLMLRRTADGQLITLSEVKDPTVRVLKLLRGETDLLQGELPAELVKYLQSKPDVTVKTSVGANYSYLGLNTQDPVLRNIKVRQAIAHAIDRPALIEKVMVNHTRIAGAILPPEHYAGNADLAAYDYNPTLAQQLLRESGVSLPLKLVYKTSTDAQRVRIATILQAQMRPAGIELEIRSLDWGTFFEDVQHGNFQLFGLTWVGIKTPEIYSKVFGSDSVPPNGFNRGRFSDQQLDSLLEKEDWQGATQRIHEQLPYIPLWYEGQFAVLNKKISNYAPKPDGNWDDLATISTYAD